MHQSLKKKDKLNKKDFALLKTLQGEEKVKPLARRKSLHIFSYIYPEYIKIPIIQLNKKTNNQILTNGQKFWNNTLQNKV